MSGLIVRSWADLEVLQLALRSGIPCLILDAVHRSAFQEKTSFMANPDFGARLAGAHLVIAPKNHCYAAGWIGSASSLCAGGSSSARGSMAFHAPKSICWETVRTSGGLTVGCFPHLKLFRNPGWAQASRGLNDKRERELRYGALGWPEVTWTPLSMTPAREPLRPRFLSHSQLRRD